MCFHRADAPPAVLPFALPAAAAGLAYLNARHAISYDWALIKPLLKTQILGAKLHERRDDFNLFYTLERQAKSANGNQTWIIFQGKRFTYAQAYENVLKYGTWMKTKGVQKVVSIHPNSDEILTASIG